MECQFCTTEVGVNSFVIDGVTIHICENCLNTAFICGSCNVVHVIGTRLANGFKYCSTCLETKQLCKHCGKGADELQEGYCHECFLKTKVCADCGTRTANFNETETQVFCPTCTKKLSLKQCRYCQKWHTALVDNVCATCRKDMEVCSICNKLVPTSGLINFGNKKICREHIYLGFCNCCGDNTLLLDTTIPRRIGGNDYLALCTVCVEDTSRIGWINNYSMKPAGKFKGASVDKLFFGIENEVSFKEDYRGVRFMAHQIQQHDMNEDFFYIKADSSIPNGFEIVSHPMTFSYIKRKQPFNIIFGLPEPYINTSSCGMHIHMSKASFTNAQLYKFMQFIYNNQTFIETVAERSANSYCAKVKKETFIHKAKNIQGSDRDQVNLIPEKTVELRIFKGAITPEQYLKNVEFAHALWLFSRKMSISSLTVDRFCEFIQKTPAVYNNLIVFLKKQGVIG